MLRHYTALTFSPRNHIKYELTRYFVVVKKGNVVKGTNCRKNVLWYMFSSTVKRYLTFQDIVIATPGRFVHLCVEMGLKLNGIEYVVFDEADR